MGEIAVRRYVPADRAGVVALWDEVFPDPAPHNRPDTVIDEFLAAHAGVFVVAVSGDRVVGVALGGYDGHRGWLYLVAVAPDCRRQGIGESIVREVERLLAERGCEKVNLQVRADNNGVIEFYRKLGFDEEPRTSMGKRL